MSFREQADRMPYGRLEEELYALGRDLARFPAPDVSVRVRDRLLHQQPAFLQRRKRTLALAPWPVATAFAILVIVLGASLALTPATREALARFFNLEHIRIVQDDTMGGTFPEGARALIGATSLEDARKQVDFPVLLPGLEGLGEPDEVYVQELGASGEAQVILRYFSGSNEGAVLFTLYQFRATGEFTKFVHDGHRLEEVNIHLARGFWLEGAFHLLQYRTADGQEIVELERQVEGNTLAWEVGDMTYRLETSLRLEEARRVAGSLAPME